MENGLSCHQNPFGYVESERYGVRMACLVEQYDKATYFGERVNGRRTAVENVADHGALKVAWETWKRIKIQKEHYDRHHAEGMFSKDQFFFLSLANNFCSWSKYPECNMERCGEVSDFVDFLSNQMRDSHSPDPVRVNQLFRQFTPFANTWQCRSNAAMVADEGNSCSIL